MCVVRRRIGRFLPAPWCAGHKDLLDSLCPVLVPEYQKLPGTNLPVDLNFRAFFRPIPMPGSSRENQDLSGSLKNNSQKVLHLPLEQQ